jgi:hypothetical protein
MESWNNGNMEEWNDGRMIEWDRAVDFFPGIPVFQYSRLASMSREQG